MFIELSDGFSVRIDEIEAVVRKTELTSVVYTKNNIYESTFPYNVLLDLIDKYSEKIEAPEKKAFKILEQVGTFAG